MHPMQKSALNLGHVYAPRAKSSPNSEARFCHPCISLSQFLGWFLKSKNGFSRIWDKVFKFMDGLFRIWDMSF